MFIIKYKKIFVLFSLMIMLVSTALIITLKPRLSIEFTGGKNYVIDASSADLNKIETIIKQEAVETYSIRKASSAQDRYIYIRVPYDTKDLQESFEKAGAKIRQVSFVGPSLGKEMQNKALLAIVVSVLLIVLFVAYAFREVSYPVSSFAYGFIAIFALLHDVLVPAAVFALLGEFSGAEIGSLFVIAMLATLGYSVNDTIVVFDRVRERLKMNKEKKIKEDFATSVSKAISSTFARSINTSLTTAMSLFALYLFGPESTKHFALALLAGVIAGTYSSIFLAGPTLVYWAKFFPKKRKEDKEQSKRL